MSPAGPVHLHTPKFSNGLLRGLYRAKATFGHADGMVGTSPYIRAVPTCCDDELIEPRKIRDVVHSSVYLSEPVYEALRQVAFTERCKIHDLIMQGVELTLKKRGYPPIAQMKAKWRGQNR